MVVPSLDVFRRSDIRSVVVLVLCRGNDMAIVQRADRSGTRMIVRGTIPEQATQVALLNAVVEEVDPVCILGIRPGTQCEPIHACTTDDFTKVAELCCGMGAFSSAWEELGFRVKLGVDSNGTWQHLFQQMHQRSSPCFLPEDAGSPVTVKKLYEVGMCHGILLAGVNCQPFSRLGDQAGMTDERASSLPSVLQTAWLTQAVVLVLECVPQVLHNHGFQAMLKEYCQRTGCHLTQQVLDLQSAWCTRRERWFEIGRAHV